MDAENPDVLIVGAGFAGLYAIHRFRDLGLSIKVLEAGDDVGGTWFWNRYPGARCDVPSLEYSFGFSSELEQEWHWPEVFSAQPDILKYANHVADKFDLRRDIQFNTRVSRVEYLDEENLWSLTSEAGEAFTAKFCIMATGCLSVPNKPEIPGDEEFSGLTLHTGLWPKESVDLADKRVGIIGTGSSAVQTIPELAKAAGHLTVFQRTPVYTVPANRKAMRSAVESEFKKNYRLIRTRQWNNRGGVSNFRPIQSVSSKSKRGMGGGQRGTLFDWMAQWRKPGHDDLMIRGMLGRLLFTADDANKKARVCSGGEKNRLLFGKLMLSDANVLIMDEPTNHMDMEAIDALNQALMQYDGTLIFVSHDREFVSTLATRVMEIKDKEVIDFQGTYDEYLSKKELQSKAA